MWGPLTRAFHVSDAVECAGIQILKGQWENANMPTNSRERLHHTCTLLLLVINYPVSLIIIFNYVKFSLADNIHLQGRNEEI